MAVDLATRAWAASRRHSHSAGGLHVLRADYHRHSRERCSVACPLAVVAMSEQAPLSPGSASRLLERSERGDRSRESRGGLARSDYSRASSERATADAFATSVRKVIE